MRIAGLAGTIGLTLAALGCGEPEEARLRRELDHTRWLLGRAERRTEAAEAWRARAERDASNILRALVEREIAVTDFPAAGTFDTDDGLTEGELRSALEQVRDAASELLGGQPPSTLTIAAGAITPDRAFHRIDTEGAAATDNLDTISQVNHPDGRILLLRLVDAARVVVVRHNQGGTGEILLDSGLDLELNSLDQLLALYRDGAVWRELRQWGREIWHEVGAAGEPAFQNNWTAPVVDVEFARDADGFVTVRGTAVNLTTFTSSVIFTLPAGYRPTSLHRFLAYGEADASFGVEEIQVNSGGAVTYGGKLSATTSITVDFSHVRFRADQ